jgi:hypothetical protein
MGGREGPRSDAWLHYGTGVLEGMRCCDTELGPAVFRNAEQIDRLVLVSLGRMRRPPGSISTASSRRSRRSSPTRATQFCSASRATSARGTGENTYDCLKIKVGIDDDAGRLDANHASDVE